MKSLIKFFPLALILLSLFIFQSCNNCTGVTCINGECYAGNCQCDEGFEGDHCEKEVRAKFTGAWTIQQLCTSGVTTYGIGVGRGDLGTEVIFNRLYNVNADITGVISDDTEVTIASQDLDGATILGSGSINATGDTIGMWISYDDGVAPKDSCFLTFYK